MTIHDDGQPTKRELRRGIARLRRRLDRHARRLETEGRRLTAWHTYVRRYPVQALGVAFGVGLTLSSGWKAMMGRMLGKQITRRAVNRLVDHLWDELETFWGRAGDGAQSD